MGNSAPGVGDRKPGHGRSPSGHWTTPNRTLPSSVNLIALLPRRLGERLRYRRYFAAHVGSGRSRRSTTAARPGELAAPLLADHANLRAALEDAIEIGDQPSAIALALGLRPLWIAGTLRREAQELADRLLDRFSIPGAQQVALLRAVAYLDYGPSRGQLAPSAGRSGDRDRRSGGAHGRDREPLRGGAQRA